jgi:uncharacterized protein (TIRG00374 family)
MNSRILLKFIVSAALLWLVLRQIDLEQLGAVIQKTDLSWVFWALILNLLVILFGVFRLGLLFDRGAKRGIRFFSLLEVYWIGLFFNLVLPGQVGGDVVKAYKLSKRSKEAIGSATAVVMDRVLGLASLVFMAGLALVFGRWSIDLSGAGRAVIFLLLVLLIFCFLIFNKEAARRLGFLSRWLKRFRIDDAVREIYLSFNDYRKNLDILGKAFLVSIAANAIAFTGGYFVARAVSIDLPLLYFFVFIPLITVISVVPISISGIGLQDGAYVFFLSQMGVDPAPALGASFLSHILRFTFGLLGGLVYLNERK